MGDSTFFRIVGMDMHSKMLRNIKGDDKWVDEVGTNEYLASGVLVTLRRPQFLEKKAITVSGESMIPAPFAGIKFGDPLTIDMPLPRMISGDVAQADLTDPPAADRLWYFGRDAYGKLSPMAHGQAGVAWTMWVARFNILVDTLPTSYDDTAGTWSWTLTGRIA